VADFCRDCVRDLWDHDASDLPPVPGCYLCEGCGVHLFDAAGHRRCTFTPAEDKPVPYPACELCQALP